MGFWFQGTVRHSGRQGDRKLKQLVTVCPVRKQREVKAGAQTDFSLSFSSGPALDDGATSV